MIAGGGKTAYFSSGIARGHDADLKIKVKSLFGDRGTRTNALPGCHDALFGHGAIEAKSRLAAAIVSTAPNLQVHAPAKPWNSVVQIHLLAHDTKWAHWKAGLGQPDLLQRLVLDDADGFNAWPQWRDLRHLRESIDANLFDLERHRIGTSSEAARGIGIVPSADDGLVGNETRRAGRFGIHDANVIAHSARGHRHHAA
jgi:hypothetical protein